MSSAAPETAKDGKVSSLHCLFDKRLYTLASSGLMSQL